MTPLISEIGIGGVGGFVVGYTVKKVARLVAIVLGIGFVALQYLAYRGIISIDYTVLKEEVLKLTGKATGLQGLITDIIIHIPFGASFGLGFYLGLKKG
jgi:uncharacterized membrane protein (Fun14 family)